MGGNGSVARTLLGVFFLGVVNNGMNILNVPIDINLICKRGDHSHCACSCGSRETK